MDSRVQLDNGYAHFRVQTGYVSSMLYARRPHRRRRNFGSDLADGIHDPPGVYHVKLPLHTGRWLIGCFTRKFSTRDHTHMDYDLIEVVD
jgi:hypothetical protein